jgi:putative redox protein
MGDMVSAGLVYQHGMAFAAKTSSGQTLVIDGAPELGGENLGPRPMELVLVALGGCTAMDVISILRKMRQDTTAYEIHVAGERAEEHPKVYTRISVEHIVRGRNLAPDQVTRAIELSTRKYCSVMAMLEKAVSIVVRYTIVDEETSDLVNGSLTVAP